MAQWITKTTAKELVIRKPISKISAQPHTFIMHTCLDLCSIFIARGGDSHMKQTGMLVGNFEFNP